MDGMTRVRLAPRFAVAAAFAAALSGCSIPFLSHGSASTHPDSTGNAPIVQIRAPAHANLATVVAWDRDEPAFGLRASINQAGDIVGDDRLGNHRLFLAPYVAEPMGGFVYATILPAGQYLQRTGTYRDVYACFYTKPCSAPLAIGVSVPDSLLRTAEDTLIVTFVPRLGEPWTLAFRHELLAAYLHSVDSIVAARKQIAAR